MRRRSKTEVNFLCVAERVSTSLDVSPTHTHREKEIVRLDLEKKSHPVTKQEITADAWTLCVYVRVSGKGEVREKRKGDFRCRTRASNLLEMLWQSSQFDERIFFNIPPTQSLLFFSSRVGWHVSAEQREEKRERTDIPPAQKHVDRLICMKRSSGDWLKIFIGRASMEKDTHTCAGMSWSFSLSPSLSMIKREERKRETERPQFLLPSVPHSSLLLRHSRQATRRKYLYGGNGDSISLNRASHFRRTPLLHRSSTRFQGSPDSKASSLSLVAPPSYQRTTHNNRHTSCSLVSEPLSVRIRKPRFPSAFDEVGHTNRNRTFPVFKEEKGDGNANDGIATTIRCAPVMTAYLSERHFLQREETSATTERLASHPSLPYLEPSKHAWTPLGIGNGTTSNISNSSKFRRRRSFFFHWPDWGWKKG